MLGLELEDGTQLLLEDGEPLLLEYEYVMEGGTTGSGDTLYFVTVRAINEVAFSKWLRSSTIIERAIASKTVFEKAMTSESAIEREFEVLP